MLYLLVSLESHGLMASIHSCVEKCCVLYFETENLVILSLYQMGLIKKLIVLSLN